MEQTRWKVQMTGNRMLLACKTAGAAIVSAGLAMWLGLSGYMSAGIITILSVQQTKKETLRVAGQRFVGFVTALVIARVSFGILGYNLAGFGVYLAVFIPLCIAMGWQTAMGPDSVLVTHFWAAGNMELPLIANELGLFVIGAGIGILVNLTLHADRKRVTYDKQKIERGLQGVLRQFADELVLASERGTAARLLADLEKELGTVLNEILENRDNALTLDLSSEVSYIIMRRQQARVVRYMLAHINYLYQVPVQAQPVAELIRVVSGHITESYDVQKDLDKLEELFVGMRDEPLPATREEFENRAVLYHLLWQLKDLLMRKKEWMEQTVKS